MKNSHFVNFEQSRILVCDDDPIMREFAIAHLSTPRVEVEVAEDGEKAWQRLARGGIDIAMVDLDMPRMDGFELMGLIRADRDLKHLPIVVVTGREDMMAVDRAHAAGATSFVVKPINWRVLSHQLSYVLKNSRETDMVRHAVRHLNETIKQEKTKSYEVTQSLAAISQKLEAITQGPLWTPDTIDTLQAELIQLLLSVPKGDAQFIDGTDHMIKRAGRA